MFRITRLTDYGVLLMTEFAAQPGKLRNAASLANKLCLPVPTVSKVLKLLLKKGLLDSIRGAGGGYRLARGAEEISVQDIIEALEGPIALTECNLRLGDCEQQPRCSASRSWQRINHAVSETLAGITLADMAHPCFEPSVPVRKRPSGTIPVRSEAG
jgi:FeS assembly SUF system regulator